jgi:hypothetical protein
MNAANKEAGRKLQLLGQRLRAGWAAQRQGRDDTMRTVKAAVRQKWKDDQMPMQVHLHSGVAAAKSAKEQMSKHTWIAKGPSSVPSKGLAVKTDQPGKLRPRLAPKRPKIITSRRRSKNPEPKKSD